MSFSPCRACFGGLRCSAPGWAEDEKPVPSLLPSSAQCAASTCSGSCPNSQTCHGWHEKMTSGLCYVSMFFNPPSSTLKGDKYFTICIPDLLSAQNVKKWTDRSLLQTVIALSDPQTELLAFLKKMLKETEGHRGAGCLWKAALVENDYYILGSFPKYYITAFSSSAPWGRSGGEMVSLFALTALECGGIRQEFHNNDLFYTQESGTI